jgi:hypothetical protein
MKEEIKKKQQTKKKKSRLVGAREGFGGHISNDHVGGK